TTYPKSVHGYNSPRRYRAVPEDGTPRIPGDRQDRLVEQKHRKRRGSDDAAPKNLHSKTWRTGRDTEGITPRSGAPIALDISEGTDYSVVPLKATADFGIAATLLMSLGSVSTCRLEIVRRCSRKPGGSRQS